MKKIIAYSLILSLITSFSLTKPSFAYDIQIKNENIIRLDKSDIQYVFNFQDSMNLPQTEAINNTNNSTDWLINLLIPGMSQIKNGYDYGYNFLLIALVSVVSFFGLMKYPVLNPNPFGLLPLIIWILSPIVFGINYIISIADAISLKDRKKN